MSKLDWAQSSVVPISGYACDPPTERKTYIDPTNTAKVIAVDANRWAMIYKIVLNLRPCTDARDIPSFFSIAQAQELMATGSLSIHDHRRRSPTQREGDGKTGPVSQQGVTRRSLQRRP
jgi:hypothetical protein